MEKLLLLCLLFTWSEMVKASTVRLVYVHRDSFFVPATIEQSHVSLLDTKGDEHVTLLKGCASSVFSTPISIGTQTFKVLVDTGSTTLAVAGTKCMDKNGCSNLDPVYVPSSSSQDQNMQISSTYGSGKWDGHVVLDQVSLAGFPSINMRFAVIDSAVTFFRSSYCPLTFQQTNTFQGILGLGYQRLAISGSDSYFDRLVQENQRNLDNIFTIQMCLATGRLWLGGYDETFFVPPLIWTPIIQQSWFVINVLDVKLNGNSLIPAGLSKEQAFGKVIVDSGSTALILPSKTFNVFVSMIESNENFVKNFGRGFFTAGYCSTGTGKSKMSADTLNSLLPKMQIIVPTGTSGGGILNLDPVSSYLQESWSPTLQSVIFCPGIMPNDDNDNPMTIMGWSVMNQYTVVFDKENSRIGFAPTKYCEASLVPSSSFNWYVSQWSLCEPELSTTNNVSTSESTCFHVRSTVCKNSNLETVNETNCLTLSSKPAEKSSCFSFSGICAAISSDDNQPSIFSNYVNIVMVIVLPILGLIMLFCIIRFCCCK
jgi:hypothetical protein